MPDMQETDAYDVGNMDEKENIRKNIRIFSRKSVIQKIRWVEDAKKKVRYFHSLRFRKAE